MKTSTVLNNVCLSKYRWKDFHALTFSTRNISNAWNKLKPTYIKLYWVLFHLSIPSMLCTGRLKTLNIKRAYIRLYNCVNQYLSTWLVFLLLSLKLCFNNIDKKTNALLNNAELECVLLCECKVGRHKVCLQNDEGKKLFVGQEEG